MTLRPDRAQCRLRARKASAGVRRRDAELCGLSRPHWAGGARAGDRIRCGKRRPCRDPQPEPAGLPRAALRLRTVRRDAGAAELAARGRRTNVHPARLWRQGAGARTGFCRNPPGAGEDARRSPGWILRLPGEVVRRDRGAGARRWPRHWRKPLLPAADRLHLGYDRTTERRGAASGSAAVERGDEPAHARSHLGRSRADRAAVLPRRRPQHPDHAGAASSARP